MCPGNISDEKLQAQPEVLSKANVSSFCHRHAACCFNVDNVFIRFSTFRIVSMAPLSLEKSAVQLW